MGIRPATIRNANAARAGADAVARRHKFFQSAAAFAVLPFLLCAPLLRAQAGVITTAVGEVLNDPSVSGADFINPTSVAIDSAGNIYTADPYNCVVWKTQYGTTSVFAGVLPSTAYTCSGGSPTSTATTTPLAYPAAVAQCSGTVFIASEGIDPDVPGESGSIEAAGSVNEVDTNGNLSALPLPAAPSAYGGGPLHPVAITCDASDNVYVSSYFYFGAGNLLGYVNEFSPSGGTWTTSTLVTPPGDVYPAIAVNPTNGDLDGILTAAPSGGWLGQPLLNAGNIWDITQNAQGLSSNPSFNNASALAIDSQGNFYVAQAATSGGGPSTYVDYVLASTGATTHIAGTGVAGYSGFGVLSTQAGVEVNGVTGIALDSPNSFIYLADSRNMVVRRIHSLVAGPTMLTVIPTSIPQSSSATYGSLQGVLNPTTGDFYYVTGANTVNVINTGSGYVCLTCSRIVATIPVGANNGGSTSTLTMAVDSTRNRIYVSNTADGNLYVIDGSTYTVTGSVPLGNPNASLLAVDAGTNEVYGGGPNANSVSAVGGGTAANGSLVNLVGNYGYPVNSLSVDAATHVVYAVADSCACISSGEALITMKPQATPAVGALAVSAASFPINLGDKSLPPAFIANSIAVDPLSGGLIASGAANDNPNSEDYEAYDIYQLTSPFPTAAPPEYFWPPITASLDIDNRVFYVTDFDGKVSDASSNAAMITGIDHAEEESILTSVTIPVFGSGTPTSPHVYDVEPNTSTYQAWISGSDATDGGFVKIWDSDMKAVTATGTIPSSGGGHLFVNPNAQDAYLLDHVNNQLWLINTSPRTTTPEPILSQASGATSVTINAKNSGDAVYYTLDGTPPGLGSTPCSPLPCTVPVTTGQYTTINAIEVASGVASDVEREVFTVPAITALGVGLSSNPVTGAILTLTATITPNPLVSSVTGTVGFAATPSVYLNPVTLCSSVNVTFNMGSWQAVCQFVEAAPGSYIFAATYSGDPLNQASGNTVTETVNPGTTPVLGALGGSGVLAINSNYPPAASANAPLSSYSAVLYSNSSVELLLGGELTNLTCPSFTAPGSSASLVIRGGTVYVDYANNIIYLAMLNGNTLYAAYESINLTTGACTQGPLLEVTANATPNLEMSVDPVQGNMYVLIAYGGGISDALYIVPTAPWSASSDTKLTMDYSVQYGPIVIDPSNHLVYINDLGGTAAGTVGTYGTSGFFVYNPTATPAPTLQHVLGYTNSGKTTLFYAGTLLTDGAGTLVLVSNNPNANCTGATSCSNANCLNTNNVCSNGSFYGQGRPPITLINTNQAGFSFSNPTPALSTIPPSSSDTYTAIGGADIDAANRLVYAFAFVSNPLAPSGSLLEYNLASSQEIPLSSTAMPILSSSVPWSRMNYNLKSTELALSTTVYSSGALGITSQLCLLSTTPLSLTQVAPGTADPLSSPGYPVVNATSGYVYAIDSGGIDFVAPPPGCPSTSPQIFPLTLPDGAVNSSYSQTLTASGGSGAPYTFSVISFTGPSGLLSGLGLMLSADGTTAATISGKPNQAGSFSLTVQVSDRLGHTLPVPQTYSLIINPALSITPTTLPAGIIGGPYSPAPPATLIGGGGSGSYSWGATGLPPGLMIGSTTGTISGTPTGMLTAATNYNPSVTITDSAGNSASQTYSPLTIYPQLEITPTFLLNGTVGAAYTPATLSGVGGSGAYSSYIAANLPPGLSIGQNTGIVSGTPTQAGNFNSITVTVTDSLNFTATRSYAITIASASSGPITINDPETVTVNDSATQVQLVDVSDPESITVTDIAVVSVTPPLNFTGPHSMPPADLNANYTFTIATGGGVPPYTFTVTGLPSGLNVTSATGTISGTPTAVGSYPVSVTVTDTNSNTDSESLTFTVNPALTFTSAASLPAGDVNANFTFTVTANGGTPPYTFTAAGLPAGLGIGSNTGAISGTVMAMGTFLVTVTVTDSIGNPNSSAFTLTFDPALTFTSAASLPAADVNANFTFTITANGGSGTGYSFGATGLPVGLSIGPSTGTISGTPTVVGTSSVTATVTDANQVTTTKSLSITVNPALTITGPASLPAGTVNVAYTSTTITAGGGSTPYTWTATGLPAGLSIGSSTGAITGTPTAAGPSTVVVTVTDAAKGTATANYSITVAALPLTITTGLLPTGVVNAPYPMTTITASGGVQPYSWSITGLPPGLTTDGSGDISGTPTTQLGSPFTVVAAVTDASLLTITKTYSITVSGSLTIASPALLPPGEVDAAYTSTTITASGGVPPYTWTATGLPAGLSIAVATGIISGTPTTGTGSPYSVKVTVEDSTGKTANMTYTLAVGALPLAITGPSSLPNGKVGEAYASTTISASGGSGVYTWSASGLPQGLSIGATTGTISGTPTGVAGGVYTVGVTVTDTSSNTANKTYSLVVISLLIITSPNSLPNGYEGNAYHPIQFTASGGSGTGYTWSSTGGSGLTISSTGVLSGTPSGLGPLQVTVTVTDSVGDTAGETYTFLGSPGLIVTSLPVPPGTVNVAYTPFTITANGGSPPYTWSATGLPPGLSLSAVGTISGTPTVAGVFAVAATVTDSVGNTTTETFSLAVTSPLLTITADPTELTIRQGLSFQTTLTFIPSGGYTGPVALSCSDLPANSLCSFTLLPSGTPISSLTFAGQSVMVQLTIETDVQAKTTFQSASAPTPPRLGAIMTAIVFWSPFSLLGLIALRRKRKLFTKNSGIFGLCVVVLLVGALAGLAGCISGGGFGTYVTPVGTSTVTVVATPGSGSPVTVSITLTIVQQ